MILISGSRSHNAISRTSSHSYMDDEDAPAKGRLPNCGGDVQGAVGRGQRTGLQDPGLVNSDEQNSEMSKPQGIDARPVEPGSVSVDDSHRTPPFLNCRVPSDGKLRRESVSMGWTCYEPRRCEVVSGHTAAPGQGASETLLPQVTAMYRAALHPSRRAPRRCPFRAPWAASVGRRECGRSVVREPPVTPRRAR